MINIALKDLVERKKSRKPFSGDVERIKTLTEMHTIIDEEVFDCNTPDELTELVVSWEACSAIVSELLNSVKASRGYVDSHVSAKKKRQARDQRDAEKKKQKEAPATVKEEAKKAADMIRSKSKPDTRQAPAKKPIFTSSWASIEPAATITNVPESDSEIWNKPFIVTTHDDVAPLLGGASRQKELA
eukprot:1184924-Pyramimonas_sp.AAC.1